MSKFVEINEVGHYYTGSDDSQGNSIYDEVIKGKILVNIDHIRCISIYGFSWKDKSKHIVKEGSQIYCIYFDEDRSVCTDKESYDKIKKYVLSLNNDIINEQL